MAYSLDPEIAAVFAASTDKSRKSKQPAAQHLTTLALSQVEHH